MDRTKGGELMSQTEWNANTFNKTDSVLSDGLAHRNSPMDVIVNRTSGETSKNVYQSEILQKVIDASASHMAILDETGTILFVNHAWREFAARTGLMDDEQGLGRKYFELSSGTAAASSEDRTAIADGIRRVIANNEIEFQMEYRCTAVAEPLWFHVHAAAFRLPADVGDRFILVSHDDVSAAKLASDALTKDEDRLSRLLSTTNILPWEADAQTWMFTYVGEQAAEILGYPAEQWLEKDFWTAHIHPDDRESAAAECLKLAKYLDQYQFEYRMIANDGRVVWIHDMVSVVRENGKPVMIRGFMIDVTERKQSQDILADLSGRLITAQEEERKRIARELHDDLNQRIALMSIELEQIAQIMAAKTDGLTGRVRGVQKRAQEISTEIHRMSHELHPSKLDHLGLAPALKSFCKDISNSRGLEVDFRNEGIPAKLPMDITLCIFRIAQEALQNAAKHSGALRIEVVLSSTPDSVSLVVSDAGHGFDTNSESMTSGLGFISMRERLRLVDGELQIHSKPSKGTRIEVSVPLKGPSAVTAALAATDSFV